MATGLTTVVETVVSEKVQKGEMFTAHDVTLEVRQRGHRAGHGEVRDAVHDYYDRGEFGVDYTRTNISVPGGNPYLYHRSVDDPANYANIRGGVPVQVGSQQTIVVPAPVPTVDDDEDDDDDDDDEDDTTNNNVVVPQSFLNSIAVAPKNSADTTVGRKVDGRQTLSIPAPVVRNVGFQVGEKVFAVASTDGVNVQRNQPAKSSVFSKYTVDSHQQIRLTQAMLARAGIGGKTYDVAQVGKKVVVKLHK
jgi:hypothetical protein